MKSIPQDQISKRLSAENPWWTGRAEVPDFYGAMRRRSYFEALHALVKVDRPRRAVVIMGPRRVGKTVLMHHVIQRLFDDGVTADQVAYISVDHPLYNGLGLGRLVECAHAARPSAARRLSHVFFDEIQYLKDWERHLKALVDGHDDCKFVASGSAAAALRLKSIESGAGRFTDFMLPPLSFHEFLRLRNADRLLTAVEGMPPGRVDVVMPPALDPLIVGEMNDAFVDYLNFGGYPEVVLSAASRQNPARYVKSDIIDKVLLRDLPSLYGISDIQELNSLFTALAYNSAGEVSLEALAQNSGVAKNTIRRYIEYLESAFLLQTVHRVDQRGRRFQRANFFKVYLTNTSMRAALFVPVSPDDAEIGGLVETAVFSQWFHLPIKLHYARWRGGEVDIVLPGVKRPEFAVEVKWSDRPLERPSELDALLQFCRQSGLDAATVTTRSQFGARVIGGVRLDFIPASIYACMIGRAAAPQPPH